MTDTSPLAALRRAAGLSQAELGAKLGIDQSNVSRAERRLDHLCSTLLLWADACGATVTVIGPGGDEVVL